MSNVTDQITSKERCRGRTVGEKREGKSTWEKVHNKSTGRLYYWLVKLTLSLKAWTKTKIWQSWTTNNNMYVAIMKFLINKKKETNCLN